MSCGVPICVLALFALTASGESKWIRISSPAVEIFSDSGESSARSVLNRFDVLRRAFRLSYTADSRVPLRVFIFASEGEFQKYRPAPNAAGFFQTDQDQDFIVLYEGASLKRNASHEYLHMVMNHASTRLPDWIEEGVPEFYSTISVNATKIRLGDVIESHQRLLASQLWLSAEDLALGSASDGHVFYAESWALVHMLTLSPPWNKGMPVFVRLLMEGADQDDAFRQAFGKSMEEAVADLRGYVQHMSEATVPAPPEETLENSTVTRLSPVAATLALADMALRTEHRTLAFSLYTRAAKDNPQSPAAVAGLGLLALAQGRKEDAQREFERAIAMGLQDAETYFQLAMLKNDNGLIEKAAALDPNLAEAHFLLGVRATDAGNLSVAIHHLTDAVAVKPRRFSYWHALGYAQAKAGDRQGVAESARRAAQIASNTQEEEMAAALTQLASEPTQPPAVKKPGVITPPSWKRPEGDTRVEGTLKEVDCAATPVTLLVVPLPPAPELRLLVQNPASVELLNADGVSTNLTCGDQSVPITVDYAVATRGIRRIEFKPVVIMKR